MPGKKSAWDPGSQDPAYYAGLSVKNAKVHPKGVSFTANNMALEYLLDDAGARSTSDMFHDLHAAHIVNTLLSEVVKKKGGRCNFRGGDA